MLSKAKDPRAKRFVKSGRSDFQQRLRREMLRFAQHDRVLFVNNPG
jgi:hypothetical protein